MPNGLREFKCANGNTYGLPANHCAFCKHCTDIFYDYTNGPYMFLCNADLDYIGCNNFEEE